MEPTFACVAYLNALPFVEGLKLLPAPERPRLILDPPFRCVDRLRRREAQAALVPTVQYAALQGALPAGWFGIASRNEVRSVVLLSRRPPAEVRSIALDANSRTSVALLKILLARRYGIRPETMMMEPEPGAMLARCDAALLIGDAALAAPRDGLHTLDLAAEWNGMTGLPFVFALWCALDAGSAADAAVRLERGLEEGIAHLPRAAPEAARRCGMRTAEVLDYLTRNIHYRLGDDERRSVDLFLSLCREEGLQRGGVVGPAGGVTRGAS